jgi:hypothetical protein
LVGTDGRRKSMAKKKAPTKVEPTKERLSVFSLKGSPEYRDWLNLISDESRIPVATIVRDSIADWAEKRGYQPPPEV